MMARTSSQLASRLKRLFSNPELLAAKPCLFWACSTGKASHTCDRSWANLEVMQLLSFFDPGRLCSILKSVWAECPHDSRRDAPRHAGAGGATSTDPPIACRFLDNSPVSALL